MTLSPFKPCNPLAPPDHRHCASCLFCKVFLENPTSSREGDSALRESHRGTKDRPCHTRTLRPIHHASVPADSLLGPRAQRPSGRCSWNEEIQNFRGISYSLLLYHSIVPAPPRPAFLASHPASVTRSNRCATLYDYLVHVTAVLLVVSQPTINNARLSFPQSSVPGI